LFRTSAALSPSRSPFMLPRFLRFAPLAALLLMVLIPVCRADEAPTRDANPPVSERLRRIALVENPLGALVGLWSLEAQVVVVRHHVVALNGRALFTDVFPSLLVGLHAHHGYGFEVDYRYYSGTTGPNGFFVGPYFSWWAVQQPADPEAPAERYRIVTIGFDGGYQYMTSSGVLFGGGLGAGPWWASNQGGSRTFVPRLLMSVGYAFR
jgi:hypothetical protein